MSRLLSSSSTTPASNRLEIRVPDNHLILRGLENEAPGIRLHGTVLLSLREATRVQALKLTLEGSVLARYFRTDLPTSQPPGQVVSHEERICYVEKTLFSPSSKGQSSSTIDAGSHEWPFEYVIDGNSPETVVGRGNVWVRYRLKAVVERGLFAKNMKDVKPVRLIRSLGSSSDEQSQAMVVENIWPEKIKYRISTPSRTVMWGSAVVCEFQLIPLLKGLKISKIHTELSEERSYTLPTDQVRYAVPIFDDKPQVVARDVYEVPESIEAEPIEGLEGYRFVRNVTLPRHLGQCRQSVEHKLFQIRHNLRFTVALHNPAGHTSELKCRLSVRLMIPSLARIDDNNRMIAGIAAPTTPSTIQEDIAPPDYGHHSYDQIFSDFDFQNLTTPHGSAPSTPGAELGSRSGSLANLASLDGPLDNHQVPANTLRNRLSRLANPLQSWRHRERVDQGPSGRSSLSGVGEAGEASSTSRGLFGEASGASRGYFDGVAGSSNVERSTDSSSSDHIPDHIEFDTERMSRVPSYRTAALSRPTSPVRGLPSYEAVTSRPPSPTTPPAARSAPAVHENGLEETVVQDRPESAPGSRPMIQSEQGAGRVSRHVHYSAETRGGDD